MLSNLKKAMFEKNVTGAFLAKCLKIRKETFSDKLHGKSDFTRTEMFYLWENFFKDWDMSELFKSKK